MKIIKMEVGIFAVNCYIVFSDRTKEGLVVDPGGDAKRILKAIDEYDLDIKSIVLTHGHGDHIGGVLELKEELGVDVLVHEADLIMLQDASRNMSANMPMGAVEFKPDRLLKDGDIIEVGDLQIEVIHTPGHTPGCISLKIGQHLLSGDTLFKGSIGRTDFEGGSYEQIIKSIKERLLVLDDNTLVLPGHGENTTILEEKLYNPFLE
ncbi:MAG: MBL fold metallo-hydrolase [Tissierellaceae bacterium]|jgi:hydroxyacylglutathione hydrolase|nr:MBL fold metallo-hydrolase [Tissierellia bacterium]